MVPFQQPNQISTETRGGIRVAICDMTDEINQIPQSYNSRVVCRRRGLQKELVQRGVLRVLIDEFVLVGCGIGADLVLQVGQVDIDLLEGATLALHLASITEFPDGRVEEKFIYRNAGSDAEDFYLIVSIWRRFGRIYPLSASPACLKEETSIYCSMGGVEIAFYGCEV